MSPLENVQFARQKIISILGKKKNKSLRPGTMFQVGQVSLNNLLALGSLGYQHYLVCTFRDLSGAGTRVNTQYVNHEVKGQSTFYVNLKFKGQSKYCETLSRCQ